MTDKPPRGLDLLLTVWVVAVGVIYFGGFFVPAIGAFTPNMAAFYALLVLISVLVLTMHYLRRSETDTNEINIKHGETRMKKRK